MPKWRHGEDILFLGKHALTTHSREGIQLSENYSLIIDPVMLTDEGVFECTAAASVTIEKYKLTVTVPAITFATIDGRNATNLLYVEENKKFAVVCHAIGSKPAAEFVWCLNGHMLNISNAKVNISINRQTNQTFDTISKIEHHPQELAGNITCIAEVAGWRRREASVRFATFVNPKIYLSINDVSNRTQISVSEAQEITIVCSATGARPRIKLAIKINTKHVEVSEQRIVPSVDNYNKGTFDTKVEVSLELPGQNGTITCETIGQRLHESCVQTVYFKKGSEGTKAKESSLDSNRSSLKHEINDDYLIPALSVCGVADQFCSSDRQGLSSLENRLTILNLDSRGPSSEYGLKDFGNKDIKPPDLELPDLPFSDDVDYGDYTTLPDNAYYSKSIAGRARERIYQRKDICFIVDMKKGDVFNRWMGTIAIPNKTNKCVVISTLTDKLLRSKEIHWDVYVKGLLELPTKADNIARCEGICIDSGHLFLLQEHLTCESLKTHIKTNCSKTNSNVTNVIDSVKLAQFCVDTVRGMEYLHSYGFMHPGLSTKKILLTSEGVCKLYDFCLSDDASAIVIIMKDKTSFSLNTLAPESIRRNEYSRESDMWAIAVVIWEIINFGVHPFPEDEGKASVCNIETKRPMNWPQRHFPFRNKSLIFDCWSEDVALRPALKLLKDAFEEVLGPKGSSDPVCTETNIYSSMEESMNSKQS